MMRELSEHCLARLSELVESRMGLHFPRERWQDLNRGFIRASQEFGFNDIETCCQQMVDSSISPRQFEVLASHLTIGETYFFRDPAAFEALEREIIPEWLRSHHLPTARRPLRIWSAGCSTGEEAYTLAMVLSRFDGDGLNDTETSILATDINPDFLEKAGRGIYREWSFRNMPAAHRARYFSKTADGAFRVLPRYRDKVTFAYLNLVGDTYPSLLNHTNAVDIIFCRNVLMYFSESHRREVLRRFHRCLVEGGWLVVSSIEASLVQDPGWVPVRFPGNLLFRKTSRPVSREEPPPVIPPAPAAATPKKHVAAKASPPLPPPPPREEKKPAPAAGLYDDVLRLLEQNRLEEAAEKLSLLLARDNDHLPALALMARVRANQGRLPEALEWGDKVLAGDKLNVPVHYLLANVLLELGRAEEARTMLQRVLYLDSGFVLASFTLGNLAWQEGKTKDARRHFEHVLSLLNGYAGGDVIPESGGLTAGRLVQIATILLAEGKPA